MRNIYVIVLLIVTRKQFACYANKLHVHPHLLVTTARTILRNLSSEPRSLDGIVFCSEERVWSALRLSVLGIGCGCWERGSVLATVEPLLSPWGEHQASGRRAGRRGSGASMCGALFRRGAAVRSTRRVEARCSGAPVCTSEECLRWSGCVECGVARVWSAACGGPAAVAGTVTVRAWRPLEGPERARSGPQCCDGPASPRTRATQAAGGPAGRPTHTLTRQRTNQLWCCRQPARPNWGISGCLALCCAVRDVTVCWTVRRTGPGRETGPRLSFQI